MKVFWKMKNILLFKNIILRNSIWSAKLRKEKDAEIHRLSMHSTNYIWTYLVSTDKKEL